MSLFWREVGTGSAWREAGCLDLVVRQGEGLGAAAIAGSAAASAMGAFKWAVRLPPRLPPLKDPTNTLSSHKQPFFQNTGFEHRSIGKSEYYQAVLLERYRGVHAGGCIMLLVQGLLLLVHLIF